MILILSDETLYASVFTTMDYDLTLLVSERMILADRILGFSPVLIVSRSLLLPSIMVIGV